MHKEIFFLIIFFSKGYDHIYISNTLEKNDVDNAGKTHGIVIRHIASVGGGGVIVATIIFLDSHIKN